MTRAHLSLTPDEIVERPDALATVHAEHVASEAGTAESDEPDDSVESPVATTRGSGTERSGGDGSVQSASPGEFSDEALLERAMDAANGDTFQQLWRGSAASYPSHSEADMALCCLLAFWTGDDRGRMDRLFREPGLMRAKWDAVHYTDGRTYGEVTVERALQVTDERYEPSTVSESDDPEAANSEATGESVGSDGVALNGNSSRSRAHLLERNRLLRQRVQEQAARIKTLEAAPEPHSTDWSADGSPEKSSATGDERAMPIRQRIRDWLPGGSSEE